MPQAAIRPNILQSGNVLSNLPTQLPLTHVVFVEQRRETCELVLLQVSCFAKRVDPSFVAELPRHSRPNAVEVLQGTNRRDDRNRCTKPTTERPTGP